MPNLTASRQNTIDVTITEVTRLMMDELFGLDIFNHGPGTVWIRFCDGGDAAVGDTRSTPIPPNLGYTRPLTSSNETTGSITVIQSPVTLIAEDDTARVVLNIL